MIKRSFYDEETGHWAGRTNLKQNGITTKVQECFDILEIEGFGIREIAAVISHEVFSVCMQRVLQAGIAKKRAERAQKLLDRYRKKG